jgi:uncharacterized Zn finger protein
MSEEPMGIAAAWLAPMLDSRELRTQVRLGRVLHRKGWVEQVQVRPGLITAEVKSDFGGFSTVRLRQPVISEHSWDGLLDAIAGHAGHAAALVAGRVGPGIAEIFQEGGEELCPFDVRDVTNFCSCREDAAVACTHAVAVHFAVSRAIEVDPFVLLEFRGRSKDAILEALRARRTTPGRVPEPEEDEDLEPAEALADGYWERGVAPHLAFRLRAEELSHDESLPVVRALGPGPGETSPDDVAAALSPLVRVALERIREAIGLFAAEDDGAAPVPDAVGARSLDEVLVAAAHQHGSLTTKFVAEALSVGSGEARRYLQWLVEEGRLRMEGKGRGTRYVPMAGTAEGSTQAREEPAA